jgi:hypothetical protein
MTREGWKVSSPCDWLVARMVELCAVAASKRDAEVRQEIAIELVKRLGVLK